MVIPKLTNKMDEMVILELEGEPTKKRDGNSRTNKEGEPIKKRDGNYNYRTNK